jgi:hypothetical protein
MSIFFTRRSVCSFLLIVCSHMVLAQQPQPVPEIAADQLAIPPRVLPLPPKEVLALLPPTPAGWKVVSSAATNQVTSWLVTIAQRQLELSPTDKTTGGQPAPPMRTTLMLIDTGYDPSPAGAFANFKAGRQANVERVVLNRSPAIRTQSSPTSESLQMLINRRFVLRIETQNQPKDATLGWAQRIPLDRYNPPRAETMTTLPPQVIVASVDELNPANNHESKIAIATPTPQGKR